MPAELRAVLFLVVNCLGVMLGVALLLPAVVDLCSACPSEDPLKVALDAKVPVQHQKTGARRARP